MFFNLLIDFLSFHLKKKKKKNKDFFSLSSLIFGQFSFEWFDIFSLFALFSQALMRLSVGNHPQ